MDTEDAIAIVGIGGMFPGAKDVDEFWRLLKDGENHVKEIPKHRWDNDAYYDPDPNASGKLYITRAGLMERHDEWDNRLFGISDAESERIDLQQRYTLECVHMALEDGGITRKEINGSNTGVYIGCMNDDYKMALYDDFKAGKTNEKDRDANYTVTGMHSSIISARVSYVYNLLGPSMTIDTACSSSLVAIHLGIQSIRSGEIQMAVCGGVTSILYPETFIALCKARMMSARGQCHAFSDMADGYARGEGCGVVILQKLDTALKKNRKIWAIITTGCNQDGSTMHPITAPSGPQQVELLRTVYEGQNIDKSRIQYIEAHGTGTPIGDPIEANALGTFFTGKKRMRTKIPMGSVKSNIGHLEASAGVAGIIKVLLMMKNGLIVRSLHIDLEKKNFNPKINFDQYDIRVPLENETWQPDEKGQRVACVNSFGFGGTNSHSVIQQIHVSNSDVKENRNDIGPHLICVSGADRVSLRGSLEHLRSFFAEKGNCNLADIAYTSTCRRDHFQYRASVLAFTKDDVITGCDTVLNVIETMKPTRAQKIRLIFVFCGVGTTWNGMCREMMLTEPTFRKAVRAVDILLTPLTKWSIFETLETSADLNDPFKGHLAIFTCQIGLLHLWRSWGIEPNAVVGQSVGEVAAAYASGAICLADAVRIIYQRSRILANTIGGKMMVVSNLNVNIVEDMCVEEKGNVNIAVYSSPNACTLSGDADAVERIKERIKDEYKSANVFIKVLDVKCAYHSQHVDRCQNEINESLAGLREKTPTIEHYSTVIGKQIVDESLSRPTYWARNVRHPVQFSQAIEQSSREDCLNTFIEIGPKPVLHAHIKNIIPSADKLCLSSMKENTERCAILSSLKSLYENGVDLEWDMIIQKRSIVTDVPKYYFNRVKGFFEPESTQLRREGTITTGAHPFISQAKGKWNFKIHIDPVSTPFVYDHMLQDTVLVPGATYAESAFFIGTQIFKTTPDNIEISLEFKNLVSPSNDKRQELSITLKEENDGNMQFFVRKKDTVVVASGTIGKRTLPRRAPIDIQSIRDRCTQECDVYESLGKFGLTYGDTLTLNIRTWRNTNECLSEIIVPERLSVNFQRTILHPSVLDAMFQMIGVISTGNTNEKRLPKAVRKIVYNQFLQQKMYAYTKVYTDGHYNALLTSFDGHVVIEYQHLRTQNISDGKTDDTDLAFWQSWQQLSFDSVMDAAKEGQKKTFLALTCNNKILDDIESLPVNGHLKVIHISAIKVYTNFFLEIFESEIFNDIRGIIFIPGRRLESLNEDSEVVFDTLKVSFKQLADLITIMNDRHETIPLFIVTEGTQAITSSLTSEYNIYGAEMWGLARSAKKEGMLSKKKGFLQNITLIDMNPTIRSGKSQLGCLISAVASGNLPLEFSEELAIEAGILYYNTFSRFNAQKLSLQSRVTELEGERMALVKSSRPDKIYHPFLIETDDKTDNSMEANGSETRDDFVMVHLNEICLHDHTIYSLTEEQDTDLSDLWSKEKCEYQIVSLEAVGYETRSNVANNKSTHGKKLIVCYPLIARTQVKVPRYATCPIERLRGYRPGLITIATVLWELAKQLKKNVHVLAIIDENSSHLRGIVDSLFTFCKRTLTILTPTESNTSVTLRSTAIVYLTAMRTTHECIHRYFENGNVCQLLTLRQFLSIPLQRQIQRKYGDLEIVILGTENIFSPCHLRDSLPTVFSWIKMSDEIITQHIHFETPPVFDDRSFIITQQSLGLGKPGNSQRAGASSMFSIPTPTLSLQTGVLKMISKYTNTTLFSSNGCYIVVGGLTGLGWEIVNLLAEKGAGVVAIFSRRGPDSSQSKMISDVRIKHACKIVNVQVDITDATSLKCAMRSIEVQFAKVQIKGIFHGAAALSDSLLIQMSDEQLQGSLRPKVKGAWNLHMCSADLPLDYFVMHSSIVSVLGNKGQTNYAAGNAFMDSLAHYRRSKGLCGQSINWGPLAVGLAKDNAGVEDKMRREGFNSLSVPQIRECFLHALSTNVPQITYNSFIWPQFTKNLIQGASKSWKTTFESVISPELVVSQASVSATLADMDLKTLRAMSEKERKDVVLGIVHKTAGDVFMIDVETLHADTLFMSLGVDSMAAMSFVNRISDITGYELPILKLLSDETTMSDLADDIISGFISVVESGLVSGGDTSYHKVDVTYIQEAILKDYEQRPGDHTFLILVDFDVAPRIPTRYLRKLLELLYQRHPQMRTVFHRTAEGKYEPIVVSVANIGPDSLIGFDNDVELSTVPQQRDPRMNYHIDITHEVPVKFIRFCNNNQIILRLVAHKVVFDLNSFGIIKMDMAYLGKQIWQNKDIEQISKFPNIQSILKGSLKPKLNELQQFWLKYMAGALQPITLGDGTYKPINSIYDRYYSTTLSSRLQDSIFNFTQKKRITLFQFFASVYQLLLHLLTKRKSIPIITRVDLRMHIPQFRKIISRLINPFPLVAHINTDDSLDSYITGNSDSVAETTEHNIYPYVMIKQAMNISLVQNIERHRLNMAGMTDMDFYKVKDDTQEIKPLGISHIGGTHETHFTIRYDRNSKTIDLECSYNEVVVEAKVGNMLSLFMMELIEYITMTPNLHIRDLPELGKTKLLESTISETGFNSRKITTDPNELTKHQMFSTGPTMSNNQTNVKNEMLSHFNSLNNFNALNGNVLNEVCQATQTMILTSVDKGIKTETFNNLNGNGEIESYKNSSFSTLTGSFSKTTSKGWDHHVIVRIEATSSNFCLRWRKKSDRHERSLDSNNIQKITLQTINGTYALKFEAKHRSYVFKTPSHSMANRWMQTMKNMITAVSQYGLPTYSF
ncbi:hypothetical protein ACJMK2_039094 [Sinanodonta woodiana]|uniref:Polyketide synthase n=1 Tax=Sinanodonta woodiana TaxID=1069815 RepID=A0ABD3WE56_SINWO